MDGAAVRVRLGTGTLDDDALDSRDDLPLLDGDAAEEQPEKEKVPT
jgi:hypothetical protein